MKNKPSPASLGYAEFIALMGAIAQGIRDAKTPALTHALVEDVRVSGTVLARHVEASMETIAQRIIAAEGDPSRLAAIVEDINVIMITVVAAAAQEE